MLQARWGDQVAHEVRQGEDALVRPVGVGQEFAQRIGILERAGIQRLEALALVDLGLGGQDLALGGQVAGAPVDASQICAV